MKFLASVVAEMKKVTWPTLSENVRDTSNCFDDWFVFRRFVRWR